MKQNSFFFTKKETQMPHLIKQRLLYWTSAVFIYLFYVAVLERLFL